MSIVFVSSFRSSFIFGGMRVGRSRSLWLFDSSYTSVTTNRGKDRVSKRILAFSLDILLNI